MALAFELTGARTACLHVNDLIADPALLEEFGIFVVPGGFSFGDHIGSGAMLAALMARTLREVLAAFIERGGLVLGVCNGFQVLVRMGLVPGIDGWSQSVALVHNDSGRYEDRWVEVQFDAASPCLWTQGISRLALPVRHGEGKLVAACRPPAANRCRPSRGGSLHHGGCHGRSRLGDGPISRQPQRLAVQPRRAVRPERPGVRAHAAPGSVSAPLSSPHLAQCSAGAASGHGRRRPATVPQRRAPCRRTSIL